MAKSNYCTNSTNVDRDTQILVEYSRLYPLYSILSLRKIIKQFDGNKDQLNEYLSKVNQRQSEIKNLKTQTKFNPVPSIPEYRFVNEPSSVKERRRHVSAPQHQVPRILVLPPTKSHNSCVSLSPDLDTHDIPLTPDSLDEGRISYRNRRNENRDLPTENDSNYEMQFYRLWKSISREIDEMNPEEVYDDEYEQKYVLSQQQEQRALEEQINELVNYRQFLIQLNQQLREYKQPQQQQQSRQSSDFNITVSN